MTKKPEEITRRNGYYQEPESGIFYPSVTTGTKSSSDASGLLQWAAKMGAQGAILELIKKFGSRYIDDMKMYITSPNALEELQTFGVRGFQNGGLFSRNFGTALHLALAEYLTHHTFEFAQRLPDWGDLHQDAMGTLTTFIDDVKFIPKFIEKEVFNVDDKYAGRLDLFAEFTSESIKKIAPYLIGESTDMIEGNYIIDFKTGKVHLKECAMQLAAYMGALARDREIMENKMRCQGGFIFNVEKDNVNEIKVFFVSRIRLVEAYEVFRAALTLWRYHKAPQWWLKQFI